MTARWQPAAATDPEDGSTTEGQRVLQTVRLRVLADEPLIAEALTALLHRERWLEVTSVQSLAQAKDELAAAPRAMLTVSVDKADARLFRTLARMRAGQTQIGVCLLAERADRAGMADMLGSTAGGFALLRRSSRPTRRDLLIALHAMASGRILLPPAELETLLADHRHDADLWSTLTPVEREIVDLIARGLRNRAIAERISRSEKTVERVVTSLYGRFGLDRDRERRVLLARLFLLRCEERALPT